MRGSALAAGEGVSSRTGATQGTVSKRTGEVLSATGGRNMPLHKHMVKGLPRGEGMDLLRQLKVQLEEKPWDKNRLLGIEFPFDGELFGKPGKPKVRLTQAGKRRHNQRWTGKLRSSQEIEGKQRKKDQEQQAMTETKLKEPKSNQMEMSHMTIKLETMTAESRQHALEL